MTALNDAVTSPTDLKQTASGRSGSRTRLTILVGLAVVVQTFQYRLPEMLDHIMWIKPLLDTLELPLGLLVAGELLNLAYLSARTGVVRIRAYFKHVKVKVTLEVPGPARADGGSGADRASRI